VTTPQDAEVLAGAATLLAAEESPLPPAAVTADAAAPAAPQRLTLGQSTAAGGAATVVVLSLINAVDYAVSAALAALAPDVQRSLGVSDTGLLAIVSLSGLAFVVAAVPVGLLSDRLSRPRVTGVLTLAAGVATLLTAGVRSGVQLAGTRLATGAAQSAIQSTHLPLLADTYPVAGRQRVYAVHSLAPSAGRLLGPALAGPLAALAGGAQGWRWPFVVLGAIGAVLGAAALTLPEPGRGAGERHRLPDGESPPQEPVVQERVALGVAVARLLRIRTLYYLLAGLAVYGAAALAVPALLGLYFERVHGLGPLARGLTIAGTEVGSVLGVVAGALLGERMAGGPPERPMRLFAGALAVYAVLLPAGVQLRATSAAALVIALANVFAGLGAVPLYATITAVVPPRLRSLAFSLVGVFLVVGGGFLGSAVGGVLSDDHGTAFALTTLLLVSNPLAVALLLYGARFLAADLAAVAADLDEERDEQQRVAAGGDVAVLQVRNLDVSYGSVQVLFGVDLEVRQGEVLALLGTNGAGKSTVLRAVSGLVVPDRGVVRLDGRAVTLLDAPTRVRGGIVTVPGGKAVFGELSVLENLLAGAHTYAWDRRRQRSELARVVSLFPRLGERLGQRAGLLSGGEQQMLAIGKALLLRPRVLLIDELSLGLAPVVVQELLAVVEALKAEGVTMVVVEQSLNVALALADRAVFLEKGRVRFEGSAAELLARDDVARAVFLGGGEGG